jgi:hypothetical protein
VQRNLYPHSYIAIWSVAEGLYFISTIPNFFLFRRPISAIEVLDELQHKSKLISTPSFEDFSDRAFQNDHVVTAVVLFPGGSRLTCQHKRQTGWMGSELLQVHFQIILLILRYYNKMEYCLYYILMGNNS